jgi:hypothetical protein
VVEGHGNIQLQLTSNKKLFFKNVLNISSLSRIFFSSEIVNNK